MSSARGATNVFSGATHHVNGAVQYRQTCLFLLSPVTLAHFSIFLHYAILNLVVYLRHL